MQIVLVWTRYCFYILNMMAYNFKQFFTRNEVTTPRQCCHAVVLIFKKLVPGRVKSKSKQDLIKRIPSRYPGKKVGRQFVNSKNEAVPVFVIVKVNFLP